MKDDDFLEMANEWLVRVQGHARPEHEKSLSVLLRRAYNEGRHGAAKQLDALEREERAAGCDPTYCNAIRVCASTIDKPITPQ